MADGPGKIMAQREVAQAQGAMLNGKMSGCAMHLGRTMHAGSLTRLPAWVIDFLLGRATEDG
jgi:hypothetical protein